MTPVHRSITLTLSLGLLPLAAQVDPPRGHAPRAGLGREVGLSPEQKTKLQALRARHQEALKPQQKALDEARRAFQAALEAPDTAPEALRTLHQTLAARQFDLLKARHGFHAERQAILSPDQREKAAQVRGRMEGWREGRAMEHRGPGGPPQAGFPARLAERLTLTADQRQRLDTLFRQHREQMAPGREAAQKAHLALQEALRQPTASMETLRQLHQTASDQHLAMILAQREHRKAMEAILTPEQREKARLFHARMEGRREGMRMGRHGSHGPRG